MSASPEPGTMIQAMHTQLYDSEWRGLYRVSGVAALIAAIIFRRWLASEVSLFGGVGPPDAVLDWFALLQSNRLLGLTLLGVFDIVNYALVGLIFLGLYAALSRANRSYMTLALALSLIGVAVYFASSQAFALLALSDQYVAATTEAHRILLLAAGQALLTMSNFYVGGGGINLSFYLVTLAGLIVAIVMLRSNIFNKVTAYVGIAANAIGLGVIVTLAFAPSLTFIPLSASAPFLLIWYILIGLRLIKLGRLERNVLPQQP